jgi:alkylation response protein AidB-like acyl-CoA dehydrogenase
MNPRFGPSPEQDWNALSDERFRAIVAAEFESNYPQRLRFPGRRLRWAEQADWYLRMSAMGWIAPNWGREWGGMGLTPAKLLIFLEEQERVGIARYQDHGVRMIGPAVIRFGTPAQQDRILPPILSCAHRYAQGFSEPDAGSDLAGLRTTARAVAGGFVLTGRKIWTTMANDATHLFALARTGPGQARESIGFFLLDLEAGGVNVRTIADIAGHHELCEVVLDEVRVPEVNIIGSPSDGWRVAMDVLASERLHVGGPGLPQHGLTVLRQVARQTGSDQDPAVREQIADLALDVRNLGDLYRRYADQVARGITPGPDISVLKLWATETFQRIAATALKIAGPAGTTRPSTEVGTPHPLDIYYQALPSTIYGGTSEIQRNTIARHVLGLPRS